jgi:hypothetical protein
MKKNLARIASSILLAAVSCAALAINTNNSSSTVATTNNDSVSYMLIINGKAATSKISKSGNYMLKIELPINSKIAKFTIRPYRDNGYIKLSDLQKMWSDGADNFVIDPPNAVLNIDNDQTSDVVVELLSMKVTGNWLHFEIAPLNKKEKIVLNPNIKNASLTIDNYADS